LILSLPIDKISFENTQKRLRNIRRPQSNGETNILLKRPEQTAHGLIHEGGGGGGGEEEEHDDDDNDFEWRKRESSERHYTLRGKNISTLAGSQAGPIIPLPDDGKICLCA
jgi:hypothetical protein